MSETPTIGPTNPYAVADQGSTNAGDAFFGYDEGSGITSGAGIIDSGYGTISALCDGNWIDAALSGVALVIDTAATVADPLGSAIAAGIGWVIDHLNPVKKWFEEVAGNPGGAVAQAQTWGLIANDLGPAGSDWGTSAAVLQGGNEGPAVSAYLGWQQTHTEAIAALQQTASGMEKAISAMAAVVGFVHGFLRDVLAQLVGAAISWVTEAVLSLGTLIPWICGQISTRIAAVTARCSSFVTGLVRTGSSLDGLLSSLSSWGRQLLQLLDKVKTNPALHRPTPRHAGPPSATPPSVPPWSWTPPDGWSPGGRHSAPQPSFPAHMQDAVAAAGRDSGYSAATNGTDAGKQGHAGVTDPDE
ncbi:hypothetical protein KMZ32_00905 [Phycicoccus sp. MAQZ13P-2]|uniref:hypothetical protein n=1 Tax=Phycicoccus mangrovi TaxID=2840470 RepID=UPI001C000AAF|nr:hypothetical protein [Phycicoccus mangrovi]MBT9254250.1 hypothetical protein [Phycicoccus mangrovi]MBT9272628.1 hypothetical protein [Phycicoccus mangrovi]